MNEFLGYLEDTENMRLVFLLDGDVWIDIAFVYILKYPAFIKPNEAHDLKTHKLFDFPSQRRDTRDFSPGYTNPMEIMG